MTHALALPHSPFVASQFEGIGLTRHHVRHLLAEGRLRRLLTGVYVASEVELTYELRLQALGLAVAPGHIVVDRTAAWLHGVDAFTVEELSGPLPLETCMRRGRHPTERRDVGGGTRDLREEDVMRVGAHEVTTPLRTALDLGCRLRRREAYAALNGLAALHRLDPAMCADTAARRYKRRRGVRQLRELVAVMDPRCESVRESWTLLAIRDAGLPVPEQQHWITIAGIPTYRLDHAYPARRVAVEYDGAWHDRTAEQRAADDRRRAWLHANGWTVIVVRKGDFTGERLDAWLAALRLALEPRYSALRW